MSKLENCPGWKATKLMDDSGLLDFFSRYPIAGGDDNAAGGGGGGGNEGGAGNKGSGDDGSGSAGGTGDGEDVNKDTGFTTKQQDQVNRLLATHKRELRKERDELKASLDTVTSTLNDANEKLAKLEEASNANDDDKDKGKKPTPSEERDNELRGQLAQVKKDSEAQIATLTSKVTDGEDKLAKTEQRRLTILRASAIKDALLSAGSVDPALQAQMFSDRLEYVPDSDTFMFRKKKKEYEDEGVLVSVSQGIKDELPDWCKKPIDVRSGSGGANAEGKGKASADDLTQAKQKLDLLKKEAGESGGSTTSITKVQGQQHVVDRLEKELA